MIDFNRAIQHPFEDKDWAVKMLIGAGVNLVPILNFALQGYTVDVVRNTSRGRDVPLPNWDKLGDHFIDGLKLFVVQLIYALPILVLMFGLTIVSVTFGIGMDSAGNDSANGMMAAGFSIVLLTLTCLGVLYGLFVAFITPALYIQIACTGQIGACFRFNEMNAVVRRNTGDYLLVVLVPLVIGVIFAIGISVLNIIPFVGACFTFMLIPVLIVLTPYIQIVLGHLYGQLIRA
jgi:hypothetical protein